MKNKAKEEKDPKAREELLKLVYQYEEEYEEEFNSYTLLKNDQHFDQP